MKSLSPRRSRWARQNTPEGLQRRRERADAKRLALADSLPPVYAGPEPLSLWQTFESRDAAGNLLKRILLYVPTSGRCDQHAAEVDGVQQLVTATEVGRILAGAVLKRPSAAMMNELRFAA